LKDPNNKILPRADLRLADLTDANLHGAELVGTNITLQQLHSSRALKQSDDYRPTEFNRLMAAAVVSLKFRQLLLTHPAQAIAVGYQGEKFHFSPSERQLLLSIKAKTLEEFALKLVTLLRFSENKK